MKLVEVKEITIDELEKFNVDKYPESGLFDDGKSIIYVDKQGSYAFFVCESNRMQYTGSINQVGISEDLFLKTITILSDKDKYPLK